MSGGPIVTRSGAANEVQYLEDTASVGGELLTLAGAIRQDSLLSSVSADGDYANIKVSSVGRLWVSAALDTALPAGINNIGTVTANAGSGTFTTKETRSATPTQSSVAGSATSVTLLASNANRLGATFFNDGTANLYLKLGATASTTSFTTIMYPNDYYEVPFAYTGIIDGISSSATGNTRITEIT